MILRSEWSSRHTGHVMTLQQVTCDVGRICHALFAAKFRGVHKRVKCSVGPDEGDLRNFPYFALPSGFGVVRRFPSFS